MSFAREPGARVTNSALLFTPGKCENRDVQCHSLDGFNRYAHARVTCTFILLNLRSRVFWILHTDIKIFIRSRFYG